VDIYLLVNSEKYPESEYQTEQLLEKFLDKGRAIWESTTKGIANAAIHPQMGEDEVCQTCHQELMWSVLLLSLICRMVALTTISLANSIPVVCMSNRL
jgi:hypothetical protein